jgi:hypothetical protein
MRLVNRVGNAESFLLLNTPYDVTSRFGIRNLAGSLRYKLRLVLKGQGDLSCHGGVIEPHPRPRIDNLLSVFFPSIHDFGFLCPHFTPA